MIVDFDDENLEELIKTGGNSKYKKLSKDKNFMSALVSVYKVLLSVEKTDELKDFSYLHYEKLTATVLDKVRSGLKTAEWNGLYLKNLMVE